MNARMMSRWEQIAAQKGHRLIRDEDGDLDCFVLCVENHNGPGCSICNETWCEHCIDPDDIEECDVVVARNLAAAVEAKNLKIDAHARFLGLAMLVLRSSPDLDVREVAARALDMIEVEDVLKADQTE